MTYQEVPLRLPHHDYGWYSGRLTDQQKQENSDWRVMWAEFNEAIDRGDQVFVRVNSHRYHAHKHEGSIALIAERLSTNTKWSLKDDSQLFRLSWLKRKNTLTEHTGGYGTLTWLRGYTGDTVYDFDRERGKEPARTEALRDRTGRELKVGDFCCYILHHFDGNSGAGIYFGTVTKFSKNGNTAYLRNIKLAERDKVDEKRVTYSENIVVLTKDLMDRMMLARLSVL